MSKVTLPRNLERAIQAALALDIAPERFMADAARAALVKIRQGARPGVPDYERGMGPQGWLDELREQLRDVVPPKRRLRLVESTVARVQDTTEF